MVSAARTIQGIDVARVEAAIRQAERGTSGEIRVAVSRFYFWGDVRLAAERAFTRLHMERTRQRNGVLIFLVPRRRRFVILGDAGIHGQAEPGFWDQVAEQMGGDFRAGDLTSGLERGIAAVGERLARHFPADPSRDTDELPNAVVRTR
jgi:uncharacterized membrane protein